MNCVLREKMNDISQRCRKLSWHLEVLLCGMLVVLSGCSKEKTPGELMENDLFYAAWIGDAKRADAILSKGGYVNVRDQYGATPLMYAAYNNHPGVIAALLAHNADPNAQDHLKMTALMQAVQYSRSPACTALLLKHQADIEARDKSDNTALILAASGGNPLVIRFLIAHGAVINVRNAANLTPLMEAARVGNREAVRQLLLAGADIETVRFDGKTALDLANDADIAALLRVFGAIEPLPFGWEALRRL